MICSYHYSFLLFICYCLFIPLFLIGCSPISISPNTYTHTHILFISLSISLYIYLSLYISIYIFLSLYIYIYISLYLSLSPSLYMCVYVCMCLCILKIFPCFASSSLDSPLYLSETIKLENGKILQSFPHI